MFCNVPTLLFNLSSTQGYLTHIGWLLCHYHVIIQIHFLSSFKSILWIILCDVSGGVKLIKNLSGFIFQPKIKRKFG